MDKNELLKIIEDAGQKKATELDLSNMQLELLPPEIGQLIHLRQLRLSQNQLIKLPPEIGQLVNLKYLNLRENQISVLPLEIGRLTNLTYLDLYHNQLSSLPLHIRRLINLTYLDLSGNPMEIPPVEIGQLIHLKSLFLGSIDLISLPAEIGQLTKLTHFSLAGGKKLTTLPPEIGQLTQLKELTIVGTQLTMLPPEIGQLTNLMELVIRSNKLTKLPSEIGRLTNLTELVVNGNQLTALPPEIGQLAHLMGLTITDNSLTALPPEIGRLARLKSLILSRNQLTMLPPEIGKLANLTRFILNNNRLTTLPPEIGSLMNLTQLDLQENQLTSLPPELGQLLQLKSLVFNYNQLSFPPSEVAKQGTQAILTFLRKFQASRSKRYEAKLLLLGEGGVGKSSILRSLLGYTFKADLETTHGVDVARVEIPHPYQRNVTLQLNAWDFAGQEIEHTTHQFFMSSKSVYLLVWNARYGHIQGRLDYWLEMIKSRAPEVPVLLVATHIDQRVPDINFAALKETYPQLIGEYSVDNRLGYGIEELRHAIAKAAVGLPLMGQAWPGSWEVVENELKGLDDYHISFDRFTRICQKNGLNNEQDSEVLADTLHNLGIILHFEDDLALKNLVVLKPNWITKAISCALTDEVTKAAFGRLRHIDLTRIWQAYDPSLYSAFYSLMSKFDLCYKIEHVESSLIPALLPFKPPTTQALSPRLEMVYRLSSIPAGLMSRFIVRTHRFTQDIHWREGVILAYSDQRARAELFENRREFRLTVGGSNPTNFFAILTDTLNQILMDYPGLTVTRLIPCICQGDGSTGERCPHFFSYESLVLRSQRGKSVIECDVSYKEVSVNELLYGIHESARSQVVERVTQIQTITEKDFQLILLGQRGLIQEYNRLEYIDTRCPNIFVLSKCERENLELQLVCQSLEGWHWASQSARYQLPQSKDRLLNIVPLIAESLPLLEHVIPISGFNINLWTAIPGTARQAHRLDLKLMRYLTSTTSAKVGRLEGLKEALRHLHTLLTELDPDQIFGGLRLATTPAGHRLWLCPYHYTELQLPPLQLEMDLSPFDVFLCHNSKDKSIIRQIATLLRERGIRPWFDEDQILGGDRWQDAMARGLREALVTAVFIGKQGWGDWQMEELQVALNQAAGQRNHRVIPVLLPPLTQIPNEFPTFLKTRHPLLLKKRVDENNIKDLVRSIRGK